MSCCAPAIDMMLDMERAKSAGPSDDEILLARRQLGNGLSQIELAVPSVHCAACIQAIETSLSQLTNIESVRVNLSTKRVSVTWRGSAVPGIVPTLARLGYPVHLADEFTSEKDGTLSELITAVAVAGFATGNIMLLSVSVWAGADGPTRDLFHWLSALIAVPVMAFAGRIYFRSAWNALRHGRMNMDVPISLGVTLAYSMSLYETITHGHHAYFDASVSLLFFLLIGRTLDHLMRDRARAAVSGLVRLSPRGAIVIAPDGRRSYTALAEIEPGMRLFIAAGERIPVNAIVVEGRSNLDCSLVTGESGSQGIEPGSAVLAGVQNLTGPLIIEVTAAAKNSFLAEMVRLMEAAEQGKGAYRRIADRVSSLYSPVVHVTALLSFLGWMAATGDWHLSITVAIAVLIITCPCALGLAVPIVQVVAARRLFENGILVKDGSAMERLAEIDTVVFDKTGTLTMGRPGLRDVTFLEEHDLTMAASLAAFSRHPASVAIDTAFSVRSRKRVPYENVVEQPGLGIEATLDGRRCRLGRMSWALEDSEIQDSRAGTAFSIDGALRASFDFVDSLRDDAKAAVRELAGTGLSLEILSGDKAPAVAQVAGLLSIGMFNASVLPSGKVDRLAKLCAAGKKVLMVGDGLNDAPALSTAHVSMAPATGADIGRNAADFVFLRDSLMAVPLSVEIARNADRLIRQNFALAVIYNLIAVPIAILGFVTPLIAAIAMSGSSLIVIGNALRLRARKRGPSVLWPAFGRSTPPARESIV
ncbi:cadmium-translocating P-type ATPase [Rhizobium herbae]|uniref:Cadmium-translocating P-type ATPase n=1 Tax=Rhizobium herbae TaxID=508661 RepID=A0ABS7HEY0_9HYPH|nr:cation-translocating P-type ATPase [Rhizobium herbae]MBW9065842.1 cadmium-translocating P-type ATPase [Rhizobium herbae]